MRKADISGQDTSGTKLDAPPATSEQVDVFAAVTPPSLDAVPVITVEQKKRLNLTIIRFLATWVASLLILAGIALLSNLEWARPKVEQAMEDCFHRHVKLGRIGWTLGLNGLSIWTNKLSLTEADGKPFIIAADSEIGVAFLPLLHKRVIVKHVEFHHPEVFATQVAPGKWNFSDLLVEGPEIHYVEVDDGVLHLRNQITDAQLAASKATGTFANTNWREYDFSSVAVKLIFPKKHQRRPWPFYLAFKLPRENAQGKYVSEVSLTALCNGPFEAWDRHPVDIELRAEHMNPDDWRPFVNLPRGLNALVAFKFKGNGIVDDSITGELTATGHDVQLVNAGQTIFSAPEAKCSSTLTFAGNHVKWEKLNVDIAGIGIQSHGTLAEWRSDNPKYWAVISANLDNLSQISDTSFWKMLPGLGQKKQPSQLSGAAKIEVTVQGDASGKNISTSLKANGVPLGHLISGDTAGSAPFLSLFKITPNAPIQGQILIGKDKTISLKDVEIPANGSKLLIRGTVNAATKQHDVQITSSDLMLDKFDTAQLEEGRNAPSILLSGKVDLDAHITSDGHTQKTDVIAKLKSAVVSAGKTTIADRLIGTVHFDGAALKLEHVTGVIDNKNGSDGRIELNGLIETAGKTPSCALLMSGKHVDIESLVAFCRSAHLPIPEAAVANMSGLARDIEIKITGRTNAPQLTLKLTPEDVAYSLSPPKGATLKPVKISGGLIILNADHLELKDLPVTAQTGKLMLSAYFAGAGNSLTPKTVYVKSAGISVEEVESYLKSPDMPEETRNAFSHMVEPLHISSVEGKTYGDMHVVLNNNPNGLCGLEGTIGFSNVSGKAFEQQVPFERLTGTVSVTDKQIVVQDLSCMSGSSHFLVQGDVKNIQQNPLWNLQVNSHFKPDDIVAALPPELAGTIKGTSNSALNLHATVSGDMQTNKIVFSTTAHNGAGLHLSGSGWQFSQPRDRQVVADGTLVLHDAGNSNSMEIEGCHLFVGDSTIQWSGKYEWFDDGKRPANTELVMTTQTAVPAALFVAGLFPETDTAGCAGAIKGTLAFAGTRDRLLTHGEFALNNFTVPAWNLKDVNGRLHSPRWSLAGPAADGGSVSQMQVQLSSATVGVIPVRDIAATILLENGREPRLTINDGTAIVAGGRLKLAASYLTESRRWHADIAMDDLLIDEFFKDLIEHSGEVTGLADGHMQLDSRGTDWNEMVHNLQGSGEINVAKGSVPKVAMLQEKLTQANLLQQGLFGFNFNNVMQTVLPGKAGKFKEATVGFEIADGVVAVQRLNFVGNDLRLRAAGNWNIPSNTLTLDVAGNIPRVASSVLPGAVGEVSRNLTIQKAVRVMTFNKLENLPTVPILGDIGTDDPRAFTFKIACSLNNPNSVQQSISKSFKWLPNKPNASAHPIPNLTATPVGSL